NDQPYRLAGYGDLRRLASPCQPACADGVGRADVDDLRGGEYFVAEHMQRRHGVGAGEFDERDRSAAPVLPYAVPQAVQRRPEAFLSVDPESAAGLGCET